MSSNDKKNQDMKVLHSIKRQQLFDEIVNDIRQSHHSQLNDKEANIAARNLIEFVKIMLKHYKEESES